MVVSDCDSWFRVSLRGCDIKNGIANKGNDRRGGIDIGDCPIDSLGNVTVTIREIVGQVLGTQTILVECIRTGHLVIENRSADTSCHGCPGILEIRADLQCNRCGPVKRKDGLGCIINNTNGASCRDVVSGHVRGGVGNGVVTCSGRVHDAQWIRVVCLREGIFCGKGVSDCIDFLISQGTMDDDFRNVPLPSTTKVIIPIANHDVGEINFPAIA